jgi:hypothetical protein
MLGGLPRWIGLHCVVANGSRMVARMRRAWCAGWGLSVVLGSASASAQYADRPTYPEEPNVHDGFYLRFAVGFGVYDERLDSASSASYGGKIEARSRGISTQQEVAIGGTIARGLVLGGGIYTADLIASTLKLDQGSGVPDELDTELRTFILLGPFLDYYGNPRRGFHLQGALGLAVLTPRMAGDLSTDNDIYRAIGGGLMLGTGYEWWVADEWSLGILARLTLNVLTGKDDSDVRWTHVALTTPSLLVSLTYH